MAFSIKGEDNTEKNIWEFELAGEIDVSNESIFRERLDEALCEKRQSIVLDFSGIHYIDSTGLGVVISAYGSMKDGGLTIKIINPKDNVKKLLNISGLDKILC